MDAIDALAKLAAADEADVEFDELLPDELEFARALVSKLLVCCRFAITVSNAENCAIRVVCWAFMAAVFVATSACALEINVLIWVPIAVNSPDVGSSIL